MDWHHMDTAPRDGTWILLDIDDGSTDCIDEIARSVHVGRWRPKVFPDLGPHSYDWETIVREPIIVKDEQEPEYTTNWASGRVRAWASLGIAGNGGPTTCS